MTITISTIKKFKDDCYGFNAMIGYDCGNGTQVNGLRLMGGRIIPPGIRFGKGKFYSAVLVSIKTAELIFAALPDELTKDLKMSDSIKTLLVNEDSYSKFFNKETESYFKKEDIKSES